VLLDGDTAEGAFGDKLSAASTRKRRDGVTASGVFARVSRGERGHDAPSTGTTGNVAVAERLPRTGPTVKIWQAGRGHR
jgi:hypothetical protein